MKRKRPGPMISLEDALRTVLRQTPRLGPAEVSLYQAPGGVLAEEVRADRDYPPFSKSAMDGYAVVSNDCSSPPTTLRVVEEIRAGSAPTRSVGSGEGSAIMTGAPVPEGADAVVPVEQTESVGQEEVLIRTQVRPGQHIRRRGEEIREGEVALEEGVVVSPERMAVLATLGRDRVVIYGKPTLAILSTGDELVDVGTEPGPFQIRNSNGYALWAQSREMGVPAHLLGIAPDRAEAIRTKVEEALQDDLVLISGGVSMGESDLVGQVLADLGLELAFERVAVKPGKPTIFGTISGKPVFGLPGNPVSGFVIFHLLVRPSIQKMMGLPRPGWHEIEATLEGDDLKGGPRRQCLPALLKEEGGKVTVRSVPWKGSGDVFGPSRGNCLLQVPIDSPPLAAGDRVRVIPLRAEGV